MTQHVSSFNAKTNLSNLLNQVQQGEEFIITRRNNPVAKLVPLQNKTASRNTASLINEIKHARKSYSLKLDSNAIDTLKSEGRK